MDTLDVVGINEGLAQGFAFHRQKDGSYQHDSVYPAAYTCNGQRGELKVLLFRDGALLREFSMTFVPEAQDAVTVFPAVGIIVECDVLLECDEGEEDQGLRRTVTIDKLELAAGWDSC